jgi:regulator of protease activity HflC (stomatin/prohibitin superfamily)
MRQNRSFAGLMFVAILGIGAAFAYARFRTGDIFSAGCIGGGAFILAAVVAASIQVADQWDRAVILRLGHFHSLRGPGLFFIIPVLDAIPYWIDTRVITTGVKAEKTLTKDTVPVDVDAVQTALRDVIGKTMLSDMHPAAEYH